MTEVVWNDYHNGKLVDTSTWESDDELRSYLIDSCMFMIFEDIIDRLFVDRKVTLGSDTVWELV